MQTFLLEVKVDQGNFTPLSSTVSRSMSIAMSTMFLDIHINIIIRITIIPIVLVILPIIQLILLMLTLTLLTTTNCISFSIALSFSFIAICIVTTRFERGSVTVVLGFLCKIIVQGSEKVVFRNDFIRQLDRVPRLFL